MIEWLKTHYRPLSMIVLLLAGYAIKKFAPLSQAELELLDGLWLALGFSSVLTPNFSQSKAP